VQIVPKQAVPIFPLPGVVLFPRTMLPLHVFELRYRTMVREALSAERLLVLALLKPGWERDYHGSPEFFPLGCLARFEQVEWLPNDCYDIRVSGLCRVEIGRPVREYPYRSARVRPRPQDPLGEDDPLIVLERRALLDAFARLTRLAGGTAEGVTETLAFEDAVNAACMALALDDATRMALLHLDSLVERSCRVRELMEARLRRRPPAATGEGGESN
jgi:Lon protease-like protein